jgi:hypothetical protein
MDRGGHRPVRESVTVEKASIWMHFVNINPAVRRIIDVQQRFIRGEAEAIGMIQRRRRRLFHLESDEDDKMFE